MSIILGLLVDLFVLVAKLELLPLNVMFFSTPKFNCPILLIPEGKYKTKSLCSFINDCINVVFNSISPSLPCWKPKLLTSISTLSNLELNSSNLSPSVFLPPRAFITSAVAFALVISSYMSFTSL